MKRGTPRALELAHALHALAQRRLNEPLPIVRAVTVNPCRRCENDERLLGSHYCRACEILMADAVAFRRRIGNAYPGA